MVLLIDLINLLNFKSSLFIAISEPFHKVDQLAKCKRMLGFSNPYSNHNNKIWICWDDMLDCIILEENNQQITCFVK